MSELADAIGARLSDPAAAGRVVTGVSTLSHATDGDICLAATSMNDALSGTKAAAVICSEDSLRHVPGGCAALVVDDPLAAYARTAALLYPEAMRPVTPGGEREISPAALVHPHARLEDGVTVEDGASIGAGVRLGSGTTVCSGAVIGPGCRFGRDCTISAGVTVQHALVGNGVIMHPGARIGQDGLEYVETGTGPLKIAQIGRVIVQDNTEIGANTTIDRGSLEDTVIGEGTRIDNLVHVAHNARIGRHCAIASQASISGNVSIGDGARIAAMSAVTVDVPAGATWGGAPAGPVGS
ncbi:UDP-3-O-(3-hydroxymyristoyl)glucosamine N-acyltransferase [Nitratireductor sp. XY-223]|uniref:UDP-3-O-(3-hydroxymyristoyl)glucosamine N-acyltransferase n=1 Tax=Nitratireductor sp. XY-223 TaxID=2561926 RepID=UPI00145A6A54|nr:UDP-3-O-(3-hydroxymyristoyl)glucosamine N-acyltransferase [Nitratireductor sp. XY-223]